MGRPGVLAGQLDEDDDARTRTLAAFMGELYRLDRDAGATLGALMTTLVTSEIPTSEIVRRTTRAYVHLRRGLARPSH